VFHISFNYQNLSQMAEKEKGSRGEITFGELTPKNIG
jgi:hypothetical protein